MQKLKPTKPNQPFTPYTDKNGNTIKIYYSFYIYKTDITPSRYELDSVWLSQLKTHGPRYSVYQSDSDYTVITFNYGVNASYGSTDIYVSRGGSEIYFYVQKITGYFNGEGEPNFGKVYEGEGSAWVEYMTTVPITTGNPRPTTTIIPSPGTPSTSNPYNSPPQNTPHPKPSWPNIIILIVFVSIIAILLTVIVYQHKQRKTPLPTETDVFSCEVKTECLNKNKPCFTCCAANVR